MRDWLYLFRLFSSLPPQGDELKQEEEEEDVGVRSRRLNRFAAFAFLLRSPFSGWLAPRKGESTPPLDTVDPLDELQIELPLLLDVVGVCRERERGCLPSTARSGGTEELLEREDDNEEEVEEPRRFSRRLRFSFCLLLRPFRC